MMYESPIKITYSEPEAIELASIAERIGQGVAAQQEEYIYGAIAKMGVTVDKDELLKALQYDRDQYEKGYADGRAARDAEIVRCKDCVHQEKFFHEDKRRKDGGHYIYGCELADGYSHVCLDGDFCSRGERKDDC